MLLVNILFRNTSMMFLCSFFNLYNCQENNKQLLG